MPKHFTRMERVNEQLRTLIAEHLPKILELPVNIVVSITHVETTRDLAHATAFIIVFPDGDAERALLACRAKSHEMTHFLSENTKMFKAPKVFFKIDETEMHASKIESLLDSIAKGNP